MVVLPHQNSEAMDVLENCVICPRECRVNRIARQLGCCGCDAEYHIATICLHQGEEPVINGKKGICNVFFSGCNLRCSYCQNYQISRKTDKTETRKYTLKKAVGEIVYYLDQGIEALGFVSPTHFTPHVKAIIKELHSQGYHPVTLYNTNGYDKVDMLKTFEGLIDVYLPDFKYMNPLVAKNYSDAEDYPGIAMKSITEMYRQKGNSVVINENGQAVTGLIIRHLVLPGLVNDSIAILTWIARNLSTSVYISLMSQYYPTIHVSNHPTLGRRLTAEEYNFVVESMEELGFYNGWIQELKSAHLYNPDFTNNTPFKTY
jgi:putative pyruvate formate lyase activating enzyme